jgi:hypothetical protein
MVLLNDDSIYEILDICQGLEYGISEEGMKGCLKVQLYHSLFWRFRASGKHPVLKEVLRQMSMVWGHPDSMHLSKSSREWLLRKRIS